MSHACERLVVKIIQMCLRTALGAVNNSGLPFVDRLLLALIFHCSKDADHARAMRDLRETCSRRWGNPRAHIDTIEVLVLESAEFELPKIGATACLMVCFLVHARSARMGTLHSCSISTESENVLSSAVQTPWSGSYSGHAKLFRVSQIPVQANVSGRQLSVISSRRNTRRHRK